jgi:large subunit ribosomal protein L33
MSQDTLIRLQCSECKNFNYPTHKSSMKINKTKLSLKKYCKFCKKRTIHQEKAKK